MSGWYLKPWACGDEFSQRRAVVRTEFQNTPQLGDGRDEKQPAKELSRSSKKVRGNQESVKTWEPSEHQTMLRR